MAQTIAEGRKFDVSTVKDLLFARFRPEDALRKADERMRQLTHKLRAQYLRMNFRTHVGVLEPVALICVDTMKRFFREQIDGELPRESSLETGSPPTLVCDVSDEQFREALFPDGAPAEYNARHAIIVFDPDEKQQVAAFLGVREDDLDRVFTPAEAKGLQFASVLVWKCFANRVSEHPCWQLMYQMLQTAVMRPRSTSSHVPTAPADAEVEWERFKRRVEIACLSGARQRVSDGDRDKWVRELKMLYVIMTRSENSLILYEGGCRPCDAAEHGLRMQLLRDFLCLAPQHGLLGKDGEIVSSPEARQGRKPLLQVADTVGKLGLDKAVQAFGTVSNAAELEMEAANYFTQEMFDQASKMFKKAGSIAPATVSDMRQRWRQADGESKDAPEAARRHAAETAEMLNQFGDRDKVQRIPILEEFRKHPAMEAKAADLQESFEAVAECFKFVGRWEEAAFVCEEFVESKTHYRDAGELYEKAAGACTAHRKKDLAQRAADQFEKHCSATSDDLWARCVDNLVLVADCTGGEDVSQYAPLLECIGRNRARMPDAIKLPALNRVGTAVLREASKERAARAAAARTKLVECERCLELVERDVVAEETRCARAHATGTSGTASVATGGNKKGKKGKNKKGQKAKANPRPQVSQNTPGGASAGRRKKFEEERCKLQQEVEECRDSPVWKRNLLRSTKQAEPLLECAFLLTDATSAEEFLAMHGASALMLDYWDRRVAELQERLDDGSDTVVARERALGVLRKAADAAELQGDWASALQRHTAAGGALYGDIRVSRANAVRAGVFKRCKVLMSRDARFGVTRVIDADCTLSSDCIPRDGYDRAHACRVMHEVLESRPFVEEVRGDFDGLRMAGYVRAFVAYGFVPPKASVEAVEQWYNLRVAWFTLLRDGPQKALDLFPECRDRWMDLGAQEVSSYCLAELAKAPAVNSNVELRPAILTDFGARKICDRGESKIVSCYHLSESTDEPRVQSVPEFCLTANAHYTLLSEMLMSSLARALVFRVTRSTIFVRGASMDFDSNSLCTEVVAIEKLLSASKPQASVLSEMKCLISNDSMDIVESRAILREVLAALAFDKRGSVTLEEFLSMLDKELEDVASDVGVAQALELMAFELVEVQMDAGSACAERLRRRAEKYPKDPRFALFTCLRRAYEEFGLTLAEAEGNMLAGGSGDVLALDPRFDIVVKLLGKRAAFAEKLQEVLCEAVAMVGTEQPSRRAIWAAQRYKQWACDFSVFPELSGQGHGHAGQHPALKREAAAVSKLRSGVLMFDEDAMEKRDRDFCADLAAAQCQYDTAFAFRKAQITLLNGAENAASMAERVFLELSANLKTAERKAKADEAAARAARAAEAVTEVQCDDGGVVHREKGRQHAAKGKAAASKPAAELGAIAEKSAEGVAVLRRRLCEAQETMAEMQKAWASRAHEVCHSLGGNIDIPQLDLLKLNATQRSRFQENIPRGKVPQAQEMVKACKKRLDEFRQMQKNARGVIENLRGRIAVCSKKVADSCQKLLEIVRNLELEDSDALRLQEPATLHPSNLRALRAAFSAAIGLSP